MPVAGHDHFLLRFAPDVWSAPGRFKNFLGAPYHVTEDLQKAIQSCIDHTHKYEVLASLANRIHPTLVEDIEELETNGYTPANRASEYAAVIEAMVCELYSVLDGIRYSIYWLFHGCRGVQKKSTSQLFSRAADDGYGAQFPEEVRKLLSSAYVDWFFSLRRLRTAFTHGGLGSCHMDKKTGVVSYMNTSLGTQERAHVIDDIVSVVSCIATSVFTLQQELFEYLYSGLEQVESMQFCGIFKGRMYMRKVFPASDLNRGSGKCASSDWFSVERDFFCPLASQCPAYAAVGT